MVKEHERAARDLRDVSEDVEAIADPCVALVHASDEAAGRANDREGEAFHGVAVRGDGGGAIVRERPQAHRRTRGDDQPIYGFLRTNPR